MKNYKILFCDLDGTLIKTKTQSTFPKGVWDMEIRFDVLDAIKLLNPKYILIVSNQGGISKGFVNEENFINKMEYLVSAIGEYTGIKNVYYEYCYNNDKNDPRRKPNTMMLDSLMFKAGGIIHKSETLMIGDASGLMGQFSDSDKKTAENFNIDYMDVEIFAERGNAYHKRNFSYLKNCKKVLSKYNELYDRILNEIKEANKTGDKIALVKFERKRDEIKPKIISLSEGINKTKKEIKIAQREYSKGFYHRKPIPDEIPYE